jgi:hypothetical protein
MLYLLFYYIIYIIYNLLDLFYKNPHILYSEKIEILYNYNLN